MIIWGSNQKRILDTEVMGRLCQRFVRASMLSGGKNCRQIRMRTTHVGCDLLSWKGHPIGAVMSRAELDTACFEAVVSY